MGCIELFLIYVQEISMRSRIVYSIVSTILSVLVGSASLAQNIVHNAASVNSSRNNKIRTYTCKECDSTRGFTAPLLDINDFIITDKQVGFSVAQIEDLVSYPRNASLKGKVGTVKVGVLVCMYGTIHEIRILESTDSIFHHSTFEAITKYHFKPAQLYQSTVDSWAKFTINYTLPHFSQQGFSVFCKICMDSSSIVTDESEGNILHNTDEFIRVDNEIGFDFRKFARKLRYPDEASMAGIEGEVQLVVLVGRCGNPHIAKVFSSSNPIFNKAALQATYGFAFLPAERNNLPVASWVRIPINFRL